MNEFIIHFESTIRSFVVMMPLEVFVFFGAFLEEVIAPIPSMLIMTTAGVFARAEHHTIFFLVWLVFLGNFGKIIGTFIYYKLGDKVEDFVTSRFGRLLGISHETVENFGKRFTGNHLRDAVAIFFIRIIPFFPSATISFAAGVIRLHVRTFLIASFIGNFCKDFFYIVTGYFGAAVLRAFFLDVERVRFGLNIFIFVAGFVTLALLYIHRHHSFHLLRRGWKWLRENF